MSAPTWATPLSFEGLELNLTELDVLADLDPYWIGWAAEAVATAAAQASTAAAASEEVAS